MWEKMLEGNEPKGTAKVTGLRNQTDKVTPGRAKWVGWGEPLGGWDEAEKSGHCCYMQVYLGLHKNPDS